MATTTTTRYRVNLSLTKEEYSHLEQIANTEDREFTFLAAWLLRWALDRYDEIRTINRALTHMKELNFSGAEIQQVNLELQAKERRKRRGKAHIAYQREREVARVPEESARKRKTA